MTNLREALYVYVPSLLRVSPCTLSLFLCHASSNVDFNQLRVISGTTTTSSTTSASQAPLLATLAHEGDEDEEGGVDAGADDDDEEEFVETDAWGMFDGSTPSRRRFSARRLSTLRPRSLSNPFDQLVTLLRTLFLL